MTSGESHQEPGRSFPPSSPAIRVYDAFSRAITLVDSAKQPNLIAWQGWSVVLGVGSAPTTLLTGPPSTIELTIPALVALSTQLQEMRKLATERQLPVSLWEAALNRAQRALGLENLSQPFAAVLTDVRTDMKVLEWCAHMFPATENAIAPPERE